MPIKERGIMDRGFILCVHVRKRSKGSGDTWAPVLTWGLVLNRQGYRTKRSPPACGPAYHWPILVSAPVSPVLSGGLKTQNSVSLWEAGCSSGWWRAFPFLSPRWDFWGNFSWDSPFKPCDSQWDGHAYFFTRSFLLSGWLQPTRKTSSFISSRRVYFKTKSGGLERWVSG